MTMETETGLARPLAPVMDWLSADKFCQWVNDDLLPNQTLKPGFPRKISLETARKWMLELGFNVVRKKGHMWMVMNVMMWSSTTKSFFEKWFPLAFSMKVMLRKQSTWSTTRSCRQNDHPFPRQLLEYAESKEGYWTSEKF